MTKTQIQNARTEWLRNRLEVVGIDCTEGKLIARELDSRTGETGCLDYASAGATWKR